MGIHGTERHWALLPPDLAQRLRARVEHVGDGLLTILGASDALRMNRVTGLGHRGQAKEAMIDQIIQTYRAAKVDRFSILLGPGPQAKTITRWLLERGFQRRGGHMLLLRDCRAALPRVASDVRVVRAKRDDAEVIVGIITRTFGMPASRRRWSLAAAASGAEHHLALAGRIPVAVGALRMEGDLAWLGGGATLTRWRRRGAHGALIAARLRRASRQGCRWAWVETVAPGPDRADVSRRNLVRFGFQEVGVSPIYVWRKD
jgi:hypothetical protein